MDTKTLLTSAVFTLLLPPLLLAQADDVSTNLTREHTGVMREYGFSQAVSVETNGVRTIYVSGQVGTSPDLESQSIEAFASLKRVLEEAGATPADVVKLTTYLVDLSPDKLVAAFAGQGRVFSDPDHPPANTLIGVQALFSENTLLEIEAIAVVKVTGQETK